MNSKFGPTPTTRLPWLPNQLSSLCRNTGIRGGRLRPDEIPVHPILPKHKPDCRDGRCVPLPTTYFTRRGELFLYSVSTEIQPWQSQVTPTELNRLADQRTKIAAMIEGKQRRKKLLSDRLKLTGVLKQNIEFPSTWLSPARETVPDVAVRRGMNVAEFILQNRVLTKYSFGTERAVGFTFKPLDAPHIDQSESLLDLSNYLDLSDQQSRGYKLSYLRQKWHNRNNPVHLVSNNTGGRNHIPLIRYRRQLRKAVQMHNQVAPLPASQQLSIPRIELNSSNSWTGETSSRLLLSRSSLASDSLSILDNGQWTETSSDNDACVFNSFESNVDYDDDDEDEYEDGEAGDEAEEEGTESNETEWSCESTRSSYVDADRIRFRSARMRHQRALSYSLDSRLVSHPLRSGFYHRAGAQVNVNAVCPESNITVAEHSSSVNRTTTPSMTTGVTTTTCGSSRWSRTTPNTAIGHPTHSPNRMTPGSTPSRKTNTNQTSLLDMAKMLLTESSKLDPISPTACDLVTKPAPRDGIIGGGDAGERAEPDKVREKIERKRYREASELQRQIGALDNTIEKLYQRTREKTIYLNMIVNDTFRQMQLISNQRAQQRKNKQNRRRRLTSELFLRHFRDRQARKRRLCSKWGHKAFKLGQVSQSSGQSDRLPAALLSKDMDENEALRRWEVAEDARDNEENARQMQIEEQAANKATTRLRWLREVANTQLQQLEAFMQINRTTDESNCGEVRENDELAPNSLLKLRAKQQRMISMLKKYGISADEDAEHINHERPLADADSHVPATIALRNLWSDLQEEKLQTLQRQALCEFERALVQGRRTPLARPLMSPVSRRRHQWKQDAAFLTQYGNSINRSGFSYFDFWKAREVSSDDEDEKHKKSVQIPVQMTLSQIKRQEYIKKQVALNSSKSQGAPEKGHSRRSMKRDLHVH